MPNPGLAEPPRTLRRQDGECSCGLGAGNEGKRALGKEPGGPAPPQWGGEGCKCLPDASQSRLPAPRLLAAPMPKPGDRLVLQASQSTLRHRCLQLACGPVISSVIPM